ncbi:MAG: sulfatase [Lachnospirales bacterium]
MKNLIYIFADQLRYKSLGYSGDEKAMTPSIDAFSKESVNVCNAVSGHPVCAPYRATLFTGKYTTSTGMVINEIRLNTDHKTFAQVLNDNGYNTSYIGKWHIYANEFGNHFDPENSFIPKGDNRLGFNDYFAAYNFHHDYFGEHAYYHLDGPEKIFCHDYEPNVQTNMAMEQLDDLKSKNKPFALFLSLGTPHDPWVTENVPPDYLEKFKNVDFELPLNYLPEDDKYADEWARLYPEERANLTQWMKCYYAMVNNLDDNIGRLIKKIKDIGLYDNSIIVFTSDHGELFGAHGRRAKNIFYEEAVRVPFLIRDGDLLKGKNTTTFNTVDIMPTMLSLMGMENDIPMEVEGVNYSHNIKGNIDSNEGSLMMGTGATAIFEDGHEWRAYRTNEYTYATYKVDGAEFLFNNIKDSYQTQNLAKDVEYSRVKESLKSKMYEKMRSINDNFEKSSYYEKNWIENRIIKEKTQLM